MTICNLKGSISIILLLITLIAKAQDSPVKFGEITKDDFTNKICPIDSTAHAYYIFNCGRTRLFKNGETKLATTKHLRVKIVDNQGFDWADTYIPLFDMGVKADKVSKIRGYTYNLEDDKVVKSKLSNDHIVTEKISEDFSE